MVVELIPKSKNLVIGTDGSGTWACGRSFFSIEVSGVYNNQVWNMPGLFMEVVSKTGQAQLDIMKQLFSFWRHYQKLAAIPDKDQVYSKDVSQIIFDNASDNTGSYNGLGKLFQDERQREFEALKTTHRWTNLTSLTIKGCDDHCSNLASKLFGEKVVQYLQYWGYHNLIIGKNTKKDAAAYLAFKFTKTIIRGPHSRVFSEFCNRLCGSSPSAFRVDSKRYNQVDLACRTIFKYYVPLFLYQVLIYYTMTETQKRDFPLFRHKMTIAILMIRAKGVSGINLPFMRVAASFQKEKEYIEFQHNLQNQLGEMIKQPALFYNQSTFYEGPAALHSSEKKDDVVKMQSESLFLPLLAIGERFEEDEHLKKSITTQILNICKIQISNQQIQSIQDEIKQNEQKHLTIDGSLRLCNDDNYNIQGDLYYAISNPQDIEGITIAKRTIEQETADILVQTKQLQENIVRDKKQLHIKKKSSAVAQTKEDLKDMMTAMFPVTKHQKSKGCVELEQFMKTLKIAETIQDVTRINSDIMEVEETSCSSLNIYGKTASESRQIAILAQLYISTFYCKNQELKKNFKTSGENNKLIKNSNRETESLFGVVKGLMEENKWFGSLYLWAIITIRAFRNLKIVKKEDIADIMEKMNNIAPLYDQALEFIKKQPTRNDFNKYYFEKYFDNWMDETLQARIKSASEDVDLVVATHLKAMNIMLKEEKRVLKRHLCQYLEIGPSKCNLTRGC
eukprot:TRINITY_DN1597_c0_g2_i1.p1 TRINITY_DN1597_c0_g2~~TRINITY_DN1597_c0_g2_i1.p1  ORF type:complete len:733 (+),score=85.47 TRINITY_DN1597_c0_g2_i1:793-2991(+)